MYGMTTGGCTTLLHLFVRFPVLLVVLGLGGLATTYSSVPGPGDRGHAAAMLSQLERQQLAHDANLAPRVTELRARFEQLAPEPGEDQIREILRITDACTDITVSDVLADPHLKQEVAWYIYLDAVHQGRPPTTQQQFSSISIGPPKQE